MKNRLSIVLTTVVCSFSFTALLHGAITFQFNYTDSGVGFNDPIAGSARRAALEASTGLLAPYLTSYTATIVFDVNGSETDGLASTESNYNYTPFEDEFGFIDRGDIERKLLGLPDPDPSAADGNIFWNFDNPPDSPPLWDLDDDIDPDQYDFKSTAIHEILHSFGFGSSIGEEGSDTFGTTAGDPGIWSPFDQFVADSIGPLIDPSIFALDATRWGVALTGGPGTAPATSGLYFNGANAQAANGGHPVPLYSPNPFEEGSSGSHTDDYYYDGIGVPLLLMNATSDTGPGTRTISATEIGILRDLGLTQFGIAGPGDIDDDGDVDFTDFSILAGNFTGTLDPGTGAKTRDNGDFDGDGDVDFGDFSVLSDSFTGTITAPVSDKLEEEGEVHLEIDLTKDGAMTLQPNNANLAGYSIRSPDSKILPDADNLATPFLFYLLNAPHEVTAGSVGAATMLTSDLLLDITFAGDLDEAHMVVFQYTRAGEVTPVDGVVHVIPEAATAILLAAGGLLVLPLRRGSNPTRSGETGRRRRGLHRTLPGISGSVISQQIPRRRT